MATKAGLKKHALVKDQKDEYTQEIPPGFNSEAGRFAKEMRRDFEKARTDMRVPANHRAPDDPLFTPTPKLATLTPGDPVAPWLETRDRPAARENASHLPESAINQGLSGMTTPTDKDDQFYDNLNWYHKYYGRTPKIPDGTPHGQDLGKVYLGDGYFSYLKRKEEKVWDLEFDLYKLNMVDLRTPSLRDYWQKKFPELYQRKMTYLRNQAQLKAKLDEINARGFDSMEDMKFLYLYNLGTFEISSPEDVADYIQNPMESRLWSAAMDGNFDKFNYEMQKTAEVPGRQFNWKNVKWGPDYGGRDDPNTFFRATAGDQR